MGCQVHFLAIEPDFNRRGTAQHDTEWRLATIFAARPGTQQIHFQVQASRIQNFYPGIG